MDLQTFQLGGRIDCKATGRGNWYTLNDGDGFFDLLPIYFCRKKGSQSNLEPWSRAKREEIDCHNEKVDRIGKHYKSGGGYIV